MTKAEILELATNAGLPNVRVRQGKSTEGADLFQVSYGSGLSRNSFIVPATASVEDVTSAIAASQE